MSDREPLAPPPLGSALTGKTAQALLWFLLFCLIAGFRTDPRLLVAKLRFEPTQGTSWFSASPAVVERDVDTLRNTLTKTPLPPRVDLDAAAASLGIALDAPDLMGDVRRVEDPTDQAMASFHEALTRTARGEPGAVTRILHYGDSLVVVDFLTGQSRRRLQGRFGDAGHGFMMPDKPWPWYQHWDVTFRTSGSWRIDGIMKPRSSDGWYGLGTYAFDGHGAGHWAEWGTARKGEFGRQAGRFFVYYLAQPNGGSFEIQVDGQVRATVATAADTRRIAVHEINVPDGPHTFRVQTTGPGLVTLFGGALERDKPGVVYDTLGINGGRARTLERMNAEAFAQSLRLRQPDLVIINFGTNESEDTGRPMATVEQDYLRVLHRVRTAVPEASCLVMAPADRAARVGGELTSKPIIPRLVATQRRAALKAGCAFYDTYEAMGGRGAMAKWYQRKPRLCAGDMTHPNRRGANVLGDGLYRSLVTGLVYHAGVTMQAQKALAAAEPQIEYDPLLPDQPDPFAPLPEGPRPPL